MFAVYFCAFKRWLYRTKIDFVLVLKLSDGNGKSLRNFFSESESDRHYSFFVKSLLHLILNNYVIGYKETNLIKPSVKCVAECP